MKSDAEIRLDVESELRRRACIEQMDVRALVHDGIVRLTGCVCSYCEKFDVEGAVRLLPGVTGVVNDLEVRLPLTGQPSDEDIRCAVIRALQTEVPGVFDRLNVLVRDGEVTLEGSVEWHFLRERAEGAVRRLGGIAVVHNAITIVPAALSREVERRIAEAFRHSSCAHAGHVSVQTHGGAATLRGQVSTCFERLLAEQTAWSVPGISEVKNELTLRAA